MKIWKIINDCLTGVDASTFDYARVGGMAGTFVLIAAAIVMIAQAKFDPGGFALALGGLIAATCAGVKVKETTEPRTVVATQEHAPGVAVQTETQS